MWASLGGGHYSAFHKCLYKFRDMCPACTPVPWKLVNLHEFSTLAWGAAVRETWQCRVPEWRGLRTAWKVPGPSAIRELGRPGRGLVVGTK